MLFRLTKHRDERFSQHIISKDAIEDHRQLGPRFDWGGLSASSHLLPKEGYLMTKGDQYHNKLTPNSKLIPLQDGSHPLTLEKTNNSGKMVPFEIEEIEVFSVVGLEEEESELSGSHFNLSNDKLDISIKK